jgi:cyclophilin family peptidyl-prolyl cis-trans isomerase
MSELARSGYYNNTIFHRIIKGFMAQGKLPYSKLSKCYLRTMLYQSEAADRYQY